MPELRMRGRILTPLAALGLFAIPIASQQPRPAGIDIPTARKAVVTIQALDASGQLMASGTGFFVTEGYVITAAHVLEGAAGCRIELTDGQRQRCSVAASDSVKDVTMLMVSGAPPSTLRWGVSEAVKDGDDVTVISNPLGQLPGTVSRGVARRERHQAPADFGGHLARLERGAGAEHEGASDRHRAQHDRGGPVAELRDRDGRDPQPEQRSSRRGRGADAAHAEVRDQQREHAR